MDLDEKMRQSMRERRRVVLRWWKSSKDTMSGSKTTRSEKILVSAPRYYPTKLSDEKMKVSTGSETSSPRRGSRKYE